jgi:hypothetical protein
MSISRRLTYANVASTLALVLVVAAGGTAVAALARNSVGSEQIKNGAIRGKDVKRNALTTKQVKDSTLSNALMVAGPSAAGTVGLDFPVVTSVTFRAPSKGFVLLTAQAELSGHGASVTKVRMHEGQAELYNAEWDPGDDDGLFDLNQSASTVFAVKPGTHTYDLRLAEGGPDLSEYTNARLILVFTAKGTVAAQS